MKYAEITVVVELSENIEDKDRESQLVDDIRDTLEDESMFVMAIRSVTVKDCTAECEAE